MIIVLKRTFRSFNGRRNVRTPAVRAVKGDRLRVIEALRRSPFTPSKCRA